MTCGECFPADDARALERTAAAMCVLCRHRRGWDRCGHPAAGEAHLTRRTKCGTVRLSVNRCPIGRHPDRRGRLVVRVLGVRVRTYGVPKWMRWRLTDLWSRERLGVPPLSGPLPGCGCIVRLKDAWMRALTAGRRRYAALDRLAQRP